MQVKKLKASIQKLKAENEGYRKDNKAAEFEAQLQVTLLTLHAYDKPSICSSLLCHGLQEAGACGSCRIVVDDG